MVRFFVRVVRQRKGGIGDSSCEPRGTQIVPLDLPENAQLLQAAEKVCEVVEVAPEKQRFVFMGKPRSLSCTLDALPITEGAFVMDFLLERSDSEAELCEVAKRWPDLVNNLAPSIEILGDAGFSAGRALRALLLTDTIDHALEWLLANHDEAVSDIPLSELVKTQLARLSSPQVPLEISSCILVRRCTYSYTQDTFAPQHYRVCHTCNMADGQGVCLSCAMVCHAGHELGPMVMSPGFFCDCGAGAGPSPCQCLGPAEPAMNSVFLPSS